MQLTQVGSRLFFTRPERENRDTVKSAVVSALFHFSIVIALVLLTRTGVLIATGDLGVGTGIGTGAAGGGGGGGQEDVVSIMLAAVEPEPPEAEELIVPVKVEPVPEPPKVEEKPIEEVAVATVDTTPPAPVAAPAPNPVGGTGTGAGTGTGSGTGPGTGPGSGGGTGGGTGGGIGSGVGPGTGRGQVLKPSPEVLLVPPTPPGNVRGKAVVVRLSVDSTGVVRDAEIVPSTGNRKYDETLRRTALGWKFRPARNELNRPVAVLFEVTFTF